MTPLHTASNIQCQLSFDLPVKSHIELQTKVAIIGTARDWWTNWDRLHVRTVSGRHRMLSLATPRPRFNPACVVDGSNRLYIMGGDDYTDPNDKKQGFASEVAVDSFDCKTEMWETKPDMMTGRIKFGAHCFRREIIAIAGTNANGDVLQSIDTCELADGRWQKKETS